MKKILHITSCLYYFSLVGSAQPIGSFYLNTTATLCKFSTDAIYFYGSDLIKTDYNGNVIWTVTPNPFSKITIEGSAIYGTDGIKVYKFDTAGNSIWTKNFSTPLYALDTNNNDVSDVIFDGSRLFVCVEQVSHVYDYSPGSQAIVTLDTSGNILSAVLDTNFTDQEQTFGEKSLRKGGWLGFHSLSGIFKPIMIERIDSTGNFDANSITPIGGGYDTHLQAIIPMADSTYMIVINSEKNFVDVYFSCTKMKEDGSIIWSNEYAVNMIAMYHLSWANNTVVDSLNNIYIVGSSNVGYFVAKIDNSGNGVLAKVWTHPDNSFDFSANYSFFNYDLNSAHYKDGKIYCFVNYGYSASKKPAILIFDTLFNNPCYTPDSNVVLGAYAGLSSNSYLPHTVPFSYIPANSSYTVSLGTNPATSDLCAALEVKNISKSDAVFSIFPNPLTSSSILQLDFDLAQSTTAEVVIYDMVGKEMMRKKLTGDRMEIGNGSLESGVYFVRVSSEEKQYVQKIIVE